MTPLITNIITNNGRNYPLSYLLYDPSYLDHFGFKQDVHNVIGRADYEFADGWIAGVVDFAISSALTAVTPSSSASMRP